MLCLCLFFFFKQKTAYEMRISDWSSDVCSSDLAADRAAGMAPHAFPELLRHRGDDFAGKAPRARKALFKNIVLVEQLQPEMGVLRRQADIVDTRRRREMLRRVHASSRQRNTGVDQVLPIGRASCRERVWTYV